MRKTSITTVEMLDYFTRINSTKLALKQDGRELSFGQFGQQALQLANTLAASGVAAGDRVAVLTYNRIEQFIILYATMKIGAIYVPINYRLAPDELVYILEQSQACVIFSESGELCDSVDNIADRISLDRRISLGDVAHKGWESFEEISIGSASSAFNFDPEPDTCVYQMYTSGTTGFPKGVLVTQQQLATFIMHVLLIPPRIDAGKPHLIVAPLFHAAALCSGLMVLCVGRPVVVLKDFNPQQFVDTLISEKIADVMVVPAMLQACLLYVPNIGECDFKHLEKIIYGASAITVDVLSKSMEAFKCQFQQGFGMTEVVASATVLTVDDHLKALDGRPELLRSCGRAGAFVEIKIVNPETREELACDEVGEIVIRAPHLMLGYSGQEEATAKVLVDGWYYSGDGGSIDAEGYVYIKDRLKDMIVSGAENVYPAEVENVLMSHPDINDVAVIGVDDAQYGEAVVAVCVKKPDTSPSDEALIEFCRAKIAGFKIPRRYIYVDVLPRNPSGKLLKRELRLQFNTPQAGQ